MIVGTVTGNLWATKKCESLRGQIFLEVDFENSKAVARDLVGAGIGDRVLVTMGSGARTDQPELPCDAAVVAILDDIPGNSG